MCYLGIQKSSISTYVVSTVARLTVKRSIALATAGRTMMEASLPPNSESPKLYMLVWAEQR